MNFILYTKLAFTGAIVLALELVASRVMLPFFGVSLNVWSSILAVTLIALAIGYKFGGYLSNRLSSSQLLVYYVGSGALSALWLNISSFTYPSILSTLATWDVVLGSIVACLYILIVPLIIFSSLNSALVALLDVTSEKDGENNDHKAGNVFFISTLGSVVGVFVAAYVLLPTVSNFSTYVILALVSALLTCFLALAIRKLDTRSKWSLCASGLVMAILATSTLLYGPPGAVAGPVQHSNSASQWSVVSKQPSFYGNHAVVDYQDSDGEQWRALLTGGLINNKVYPSGESATAFTFALEALSHSNVTPPKSVLVLGLGVGIVASRLASKGVLVDAVELDGRVVDIAREYFGFDSSGISVTVEDARTYVRNCPKEYDVVIVDLFRGGGIPSHVVSREFFTDVWSCLSTDGSIVMNTFYGTTDVRSKKSLFKTVSSVFNDIVVFEYPAQPQAGITQGYILARKTDQKWNFNIPLDHVPAVVLEELTPALKNWSVYNQHSLFLRGVMPISDKRNDWNRRTEFVDTLYRKRLTAFIPWQVLLD